MKILLLGEYSNVHWTLAKGLRALGHDVTVISNGDGWKNYCRDISLQRNGLKLIATLRYALKLLKLLPKLRNYDIVQLINPVFLDIKAERIKPIYSYIRRHNNKVFLGAYGIDHYWVKTGLDCHTFRYSDFNIGNELRINEENAQYQKEWLNGKKGQLNKLIAQDCDGIISGLYEYYACYKEAFSEKMRFIPFPIDCNSVHAKVRKVTDGQVHFFIGIQKQRNVYKGTDIMLKALQKLQRNHPTLCKVTIAESVPFNRYIEMMDSAHVILDQLYSYTPAMNALQAMAQGLVVVGGGEPENYEILDEQDLRPIINVEPNEDSVYNALLKLVENTDIIESLSKQSIEYIHKHHDHVNVAKEYEDFYLQVKQS